MYNIIIKDNIHYGCFIHNHISMNKLLRKIVFTDMAIRSMPARLIKNPGRNNGDIPFFRQPIIPTAHWSDGPLFRRPIVPTAHYSDQLLAYKVYNIFTSVHKITLKTVSLVERWNPV